MPTLISPLPASTDTGLVPAAGANMTNNSGLSATLNGGETLATASTITHVLSPTGHNQSWLTTDGGVGGDYFDGAGGGAGAGPALVFIWDLGSDQSVDNFIMWHYGNNGGGSTLRGNHAKDFTLQFNTDAQGSATFAGATSNFVMAPDTGTSGTSAAQVFATGGVAARYVRLEITDNYFGTAPMTGGGSRVGIGELRFDVSAVPEPSSTALLGLGGLALILRRRK